MHAHIVSLDDILFIGIRMLRENVVVSLVTYIVFIGMCFPRDVVSKVCVGSLLSCSLLSGFPRNVYNVYWNVFPS